MKKKHESISIFLLSLILIAYPLLTAEAQENEAPSYTPPPMFGTNEAPVLSRPLKEKMDKNSKDSDVVLQHPIDNKKTETSRKPFIAKRPVYETFRKPKPPVPAKKPDAAPKTKQKKEHEFLPVADFSDISESEKRHEPQPIKTNIEEIKQEIKSEPQKIKKDQKKEIATTEESLDLPPLPRKKPAHTKRNKNKIPSPKYTASGDPIMPAVPPKPVEQDSLPDPIETVSEAKEPEVNKLHNSVANIKLDKDTKQKISLAFDEGESTLKAAMLSTMNSEILPALRKSRSSRVQIMAYAKPVDNSFNSARRLSLARALAVREFLLQNGIEARRIDVRGMGTKNQASPTDLVDLILIN